MSAPDPQAPRATGWFDAEDAPTRRDLETCIHCGLCLTACPTYRTDKTEPDSPRGRLYLMRGLSEGRIAPSDPLVEHLDRCLDCRACETVCPAGVPYSRLLEATRGQVARRLRRPSFARGLGTFVLRHVLPHPGRVQALADLLRLGQQPPLAPLLRSRLVQRMLPGFASQGLAMTPPIPPRAGRTLAAATLPPGAIRREEATGTTFRPAGAPRGRVAFHVGCVMEPLFAPLNRAVVRLLLLAGTEVWVPRAQTCCGALHAHAGLRREAKQLAGANVAAFAGDADFVISHSAGCGAALRETGHLLGDDGAPRAFAERVRDVSEVLAHYGLPAPARALRAADGGALRVAYHDPCHLAHAQRVREAPRRLLRALPGVTLFDLPNSDWCCGSAGVYNLTQPVMADAQLAQKLASIDAVQPHVVVASNPGCLLHMRRGELARGGHVRMAHLVELLDEAHAPGAPRV